MARYNSEEEVLAHYDPKKYRTPDGYTSDIAVFTIISEPIAPNKPPKRTMKLMLIRRARHDREGSPNIEGGKWALPGGFIDPEEVAYEAAKRELSEETGVEGIHIRHYGVYDKLGRDKRGWIISNAHYAIVPEDYLEKRKAADDAEEVALFTIEEIKELELAFDHREVIADAYEMIRKDMLLSTVARSFLPQEFTLSELQSVLLTVTDSPKVAKYSTFRNRAERLPFIEVVRIDGEAKTTSRNSKRPSILYRFKEGEPLESIYF
ncbi:MULTISPECIES: NUDIX domain-containing protein [Paenibacillus]|uniref:ADP-ribose pyrophosphatase n=1 Tax=Paenibacillus glycanilyticus TaxID=126569 RepID=A0ABQ6NPT0_9BACL|nr:NUDIX domain-containing protein [Paenibacillus glycanilyticus]GMK47082.1 ADP-ribose pyrophosphatase [Paenibacillus glycanilyticus]